MRSLGTPAPSVRFVSTPADTPILTVPILPLTCSLDGNRLGDKGITALAAILNETQITHLRCADIPVVFAFVSAPVARFYLRQ